jgi:hypothetical protein
LLYFLHGHHQADATAEAPSPAPVVSVATAHTGFIANQLTVAGVFQAFQEIDVHGKASDQYCARRWFYIPVLKQGGGSNTITIVDGIRKATAHLLDIPQLKTSVVFDQSVFC